MAVEVLVAVLGLAGSALVAVLASRSQATAVLGTLTQAFQDRIAQLEGRVEDLWRARREDASLIRRMGDQIDILEDHIWKEKGPPPPPRPEGL
ncbi:MAG: hypothetical protein LBK42_10440 [Propionibacteriaceae bacterium]|jgi:hypothetical protein|nr:hypothetical protein [Propionibacteriaceae bacterium]